MGPLYHRLRKAGHGTLPPQASSNRVLSVTEGMGIR